MRYKVPLDGSEIQYEIKDFDFVVDTLADGSTRLAKQQSVPLEFADIMRN